MFNNKRIKELRQRVRELEKTCDNLDASLDYKNDIINDLQRKITEQEYREQLFEKERKELNNVISNLIEEKNKLTAKKIRSAKSTKRNTSK
jgi:exonuclease VII small subunit